jgi:hypothetical protein
MRKMKILSAIAFSMIVLAGCKSSASKQSTGYVGKLVVKELCNHYVVAVESGNLDTSKLAATWTDSKRNTPFRNVFTVASKCSFANSGLEEGDRFSFELSDNHATENCAVCMAYYETPVQFLYIKNIRKITSQ